MNNEINVNDVWELSKYFWDAIIEDISILIIIPKELYEPLQELLIEAEEKDLEIGHIDWAIK